VEETTTAPESRPPLAEVRSGAELRRWYWLRSELQELAGRLDLPRHGRKEELVDRIVAALDGAPAPAPAHRRPGGRQLTAPVGPETVIPPGQRCGARSVSRPGRSTARCRSTTVRPSGTGRRRRPSDR